jgi:DNA-binding MarR family transcriptional regulator
MDTNSEALATQMLWIIKRLTFLERNSVFPHGDLKLYPSEIHLMLLIDDEQASNVTEMANKLGVTKGAISQTLSRLVKKGVLEKTKDPYNKNELTATFTALGQEALEQYRALRTSFRNQYVHYFFTLSESEREVIGRFLSQMEAILDRSHK